MRCPRCNTDNMLGMTYCAGCGAKLEMTDREARLEAAADVTHESWRRASLALNRVLFLFFVVLVASFLFRAYATRDVLADFSPAAPLPPPPPLVLPPTLAAQPELPIPDLPAAAPLKADKGTEPEILADLALTARDRLNCGLTLKAGGAVKGALLGRTKDELLVIVNWGPPLLVRPVKADEVDFTRSQLPE